MVKIYGENGTENNCIHNSAFNRYSYSMNHYQTEYLNGDIIGEKEEEIQHQERKLARRSTYEDENSLHYISLKEDNNGNKNWYYKNTDILYRSSICSCSPKYIAREEYNVFKHNFYQN